MYGESYVLTIGSCIACKAQICFNPIHVPSIRVDGLREPICLNCFNRWNKIHRLDKGLEAVGLHARAYSAEPEANC